MIFSLEADSSNAELAMIDRRDVLKSIGLEKISCS